MAQWGIRMVSENFEKNFLTFLGLGTNVVKVSSVNSELLFQSDTLSSMLPVAPLEPTIGSLTYLQSPVWHVASQGS